MLDRLLFNVRRRFYRRRGYEILYLFKRLSDLLQIQPPNKCNLPFFLLLTPFEGFTFLFFIPHIESVLNNVINESKLSYFADSCINKHNTAEQQLDQSEPGTTSSLCVDKQ